MYPPRRLALPFFLALLTLAGTPRAALADAPPVTTVPQVDLARYVGRWYEIAAYPMFFQRRCIGDVTAQYAPLYGNRISVINRCQTEDGPIEAKGEATTVEGSGNARLRVSFFWPFSAPYWIIGLDPDYRWAVIGHPDRKTLWILARQPTLGDADWQAARRLAEAQGYDLAGLRVTRHTERGTEP